MKKIAVLLLLLFVLPIQVVGAVPEKPDSLQYVYDYAGVIEDEAEERMRQALKQIEEQTTNQVVLLAVPTLDGMEPGSYGHTLIREWGIGQADENNGMAIFFTTGQGAGQEDVWIATGYGLEADFPDSTLGQMIDEAMLESLKAGHYTAAAANIVDELASRMQVEDINVASTLNGEEQVRGDAAVEEEMSWFDIIVMLVILAVVLGLGIVAVVVFISVLFGGLAFIWAIVMTIIEFIVGLFSKEKAEAMRNARIHNSTSVSSTSSSSTSASSSTNDYDYYSGGHDSSSSSNDSDFGGGDSGGGGAGRDY